MRAAPPGSSELIRLPRLDERRRRLRAAGARLRADEEPAARRLGAALRVLAIPRNFDVGRP